MLFTFLTTVTRLSRSTFNFYALIGQNLAGELMRNCLKYHYPREVASEDEYLKYLEPDFVVLENVFPY